MFNLFTDPLSTEDFEDNHKAVEEVGEVPSRHLTFREHTLLRAVVVPVQLHSHHGEDEDDDAQHQGEVSQRAHRLAHDRDEQVEGGPRLGQLEYAELKG